MTQPLKRRKLGNTDITLSELTLGTWGLCAEAYGKVFAEQRSQTLARAIDAGIRAFDMAPTWGSDGLSERAVAEAVGARRDEITYITRAGLAAGEHGPEPALSTEQLRASCEASLRRLNTDRIDIWLVHNPGEESLRRDEVVSTAEALVVEGKIRVWGAAVAHVDEARAAIEGGAQALCLPFNLMRPELLFAIEQECTARQVGILARSTLLYGLLSGRFGAKKRFAAGDHRAQRWSPEALAERVRQVGERRALMQPPSLTLASFALRFVLAHDQISSAVIGARTPGQVDASRLALDANGPDLTPEGLADVRRQLG